MTKATCSVVGCKRPRRCRHLCDMHYRRWRRDGEVGEPEQRRSAHRIRKSNPDELLLAQTVRADNGCLLWTGYSKRNGYGWIDVDGRPVPAHRWVWEQFVGPIPEDLTIDHLCHNADPACLGGACIHRRCVDINHLEPISHAINIRRGARRLTHCKHGHEWTEDTTRITRQGRRRCRICDRIREQARDPRRR